MVMRKGVEGEIYNIGTEEEKTVLQVVHTLLKAYGLESKADQVCGNQVQKQGQKRKEGAL